MKNVVRRDFGDAPHFVFLAQVEFEGLEEEIFFAGAAGADGHFGFGDVFSADGDVDVAEFDRQAGHARPGGLTGLDDVFAVVEDGAPASGGVHDDLDIG